MKEKDILRKQIKKAVAQLSSEEKKAAAVALKKRIETSSFFVEARTILLFHSLPDEVCTHEWIADWHSRKKILLPVVKGDTLVVRPYAPDKMSTGSYGIAEPAGEDVTDYSDIDLVIVPGVGFDPHGNRLGRGKGFYDRLLKKISAPFTGVAYDCQIVAEIPSLPHDVAMSWVVTPNHLYQLSRDTRKSLRICTNRK